MLIEKITKISLPLLLSLSIFSCNSVNITNPNINTSLTRVNYSSNVANIDLAQKNGASLKFGISRQVFKTKAASVMQNMPNNLAGNSPKESMDIKSYKVWLIKNSSPVYPAGADPIGDAVAGPFEINGDVAGVSFNNVGSSDGDYYFMALQAFDGALDVDGHVTGKSLIKQNNGSNIGWKGSSAYPENRIAVSNSVKVDNNNQVSSLTALNLVPMLEDGFGSTVNSQFKLSPNMADKEVNKCGGLTPSSHVQTVLSGIESPTTVEVNPVDGSLYVLSEGDSTNTIKKFSKDGTSSDIVSESSISAFAFDPSGNLYYTKMQSAGNYVVMRRLKGSTTDTIYAGGAFSSGSNPDPRKATFADLGSNSIDFDNLGNLYIFVNGSGNILSAAKSTSFIAKVSTGGNSISLFSETYPNSDPFDTDEGEIKVSKSGYLYFADVNEGDVHRYSLLSGSSNTVFDNANTTQVYNLEIDSNNALYYSFGNDGGSLGLYKLDDGSGFGSAQTILAPNAVPSPDSIDYLPVAQVVTNDIFSTFFDTAGNLYYSENPTGQVNVIYNDCDYNEVESAVLPPT